MGKKCIICDDEAEFKIKDTPDYYCRECALDHFADLDVLVKVEEEAQRLKQFIKQKLEEEVQTNGTSNNTWENQDITN